MEVSNDDVDDIGDANSLILTSFSNGSNGEIDIDDDDDFADIKSIDDGSSLVDNCSGANSLNNQCINGDDEYCMVENHDHDLPPKSSTASSLNRPQAAKTNNRKIQTSDGTSRYDSAYSTLPTGKLIHVPNRRDTVFTCATL